ncbi:ExeM/NucH family extracellular endonuclease [Natronospira bacteriovora]|uniref:ExeM/NucH family extracellular endonuclease n=1 Tax=Natronospira bacteriovora TaxID=3069753 RepID=A0ABU0W5S9_9GAMM|nr:ExeM/NucH family extracellular endonuclease [Natronospira sp. AB-CW4]MDQ2068815.1 ExeM/NucH family extracellular endonuclease [Natronospira sp. AB-CW4]
MDIVNKSLIVVFLAWFSLLCTPAWADCPVEGLTPIAELKGESGARQEGERVLVRGIVTGDFRGEEQLNGFYLQSGEPATGIFVYAPGLSPAEPVIASGQDVVIAARAGEFRGQRQLGRVSQILVCGEPGLPDPLPLELPEADRQKWQRFEGRLVEIEGPLTVTGSFELARYGSLDLVAGPRLFRPGNFPGGLPEALRRSRDHAAYRIILDDAHYRQHPDPTPYLDENGTRRVGSQLPSLQGILTHAFGRWRIHPLAPDTLRFEDSNPRPPPPARHGGPRLAAFNVENYFLTLGERGASDEQELAAQRRALQAVTAGLDADLVGLIEVENRPMAVHDLLNRLGEGLEHGGYHHFNLGEAVGTDAIRSVLAWRPERVEKLAGPFIDDRRVHHRPVVAGHFRLGGEGPGKLVAVIHFKAKSGCPESGDIDRGQGCWNERRTRQSEALIEFLDRKREKTGTNRVIIMGDINSYGGEDPVQALRDAGYVDLVANHVPAEQRYSYVFRGESGYLDTAIASPELADDIQRVHFWPINADEPRFLQFQQPGPWRSSDHDPVIIDLRNH